MANRYKKLISYLLAKRQNTKSQTPGFSLTHHKKPRKCRILRGAKRVGFWLRTTLRGILSNKKVRIAHVQCVFDVHPPIWLHGEFLNGNGRGTDIMIESVTQ